MNEHNTKQSSAPAHINTRAAWRPILGPIAKVLIAAQLALVLQPLSAMTRDNGQAAFNPVADAQVRRYAQLNQSIEQSKASAAASNKSPADQASDKLAQAQELVAQLRAANTPDKAAKHQQLKSLLVGMQQGQADVRAEFAQTRSELQKKNLPAEILQRHDEAVAQFEQRVTQFNQQAAKTNDEERVQGLSEFFAQNPSKRKPLPFNKKLPWSTPTPSTRAPAETQAAWLRNLGVEQPVRLAAKPKTTESSSNKLAGFTLDPNRASPSAIQSVAWRGDPAAQPVQLAQANIGPLQFNIAPDPSQAPTTSDLAETDEVQLTAGIRAKAAELGNNPVNIYNWVRNNIEWAPTAGAIQSAQDTLDKKRGNATDTASLLIALLRAANVPARYQWGTIDVPAEQAMNWVGGATVPQAALQILGQGGIAARGLASGGRITTVRMEHVWVNAYVNWTPSRGNRQGGANLTPPQHVNPNGNLNAWVPLDAAFKQYTYAPGMDLKTAVPLDASALLNAAKQGATVNEAEGWVQNLNQAAIQSQMADYQSRLKTYIDSTATGANSTVGDAIGKKIIPQRIPSMLAGVEPNVVVLRGAQAASVPTNLQHKFTYRLYASQTDQANDAPMLTFTEKTSKLAGKRLTLTYVPATPTDADIIASYLPQPHTDGSPIQPSELPTSLPGYLIRLKATINLDGQVVAQSSRAVQMGADLYSTGGFTQLYDTNQWDLTSEESNVAGQTTAIGLSAGGIGFAQTLALASRLNNLLAQVQNPGLGSAPLTVSFTGEQLSGDLLTATLWDWFAMAELHSNLSQGQAQMVESPGLSYGLLHAVVQPTYSWGVARKVTFPGVNMDIGHVRNLTWAKDNVAQNWAGYNRLRGQQMSLLEQTVPEKFFSDRARCNVQPEIPSDAPPCKRGISAVGAIAQAAQDGQKIFTLSASVVQADPNVVPIRLWQHSTTTKDRVQQALEAGYEVMIHERPVTRDGWIGAGFTLIDPATGAGAYLIDGGSNGGFKRDDEAGTSITYTTANPNPTAGTAFMMAGLVAQARTSLVARQALATALSRALPAVAGSLAAAGPVAVAVLTIAVVLLIIVVIWQMIAAAAAESEDIRQQVISNAQANPLTRDWPLDNCYLTGQKVGGIVPGGWKQHIYACRLAGQPIARFFPAEVPSPYPVPCVPGIYFALPLPRAIGDPFPPTILQCTVG